MDFLETSSVCRLCLKISSGGNIQMLEGSTMYMLKLVAPAVNLEISSEPKICKNCADKLKSTHDFKSVCLEINEISQPAFLNNTKPHKENIYKCCLCEKKYNLKKCKANEILLLNTMLEKCLPELDMEKNSTICQECLRSVVNLFAFLNCCLDTENKIKKYVQVTGLNKKRQVSILDIFHANIIVKEEDLKEVEETKSIEKVEEMENPEKVEEVENPEEVEEVDNPEEVESPEEVENPEEAECDPEPVNTTGSKEVKSESNVDSEAEINIDISENTLKMEELDECEKSDHDVNGKAGGTTHREEMGDSVPLRVSNNSVKSSSLKRKRQIRNSASKGRKHFTSDDQECTFRTGGKPFKCDECSYETGRKCHLLQHSLIHKDISEVEMHRCDKCKFETKYKGNMIQHMRMHRDPKTQIKLKCDKCSYVTDHKFNLRKHSMVHKDKSEVSIHKCTECDFETRYKKSIMSHILMHKDASEVEMLKCENCDFETKHKSSMIRHVAMHKDKSEVEIYKCENCEYETRERGNMVRHVLKHRDLSGGKKFKCNKCPYETDIKYYLSQHKLIHKDTSQVEMHNVTLKQGIRKV